MKHIKSIPEKSILVITSKVVALSEGRTVVAKDKKAKEKITYVKEHSDISLKELYEIMKEEFCKGKDFCN